MIPVNENQNIPPSVECPECGAALEHVQTEISSGAFVPGGVDAADAAPLLRLSRLQYVLEAWD